MSSVHSSRHDGFRSLVRGGWITTQHGAWAMMIVPLIVGSILGGPTLSQLVLAVTWLIAFFFFSVLGQWIKVSASARSRADGKPLSDRQKATVTRRQKRYLPAMATYGAIAGVGALLLVALHPGLLMWAIPFALLFSVAVWEMWRGHDRSFLSRASAILASQMLTPIAFGLGANPSDWSRAWIATAILTAYFVGTIPYVKTLIRERGNPLWIRVSLGYHLALTGVAVACVLAGWVSWWVVGLAVVLTTRAAAFPAWSYARGRPLRPAVIGFTEFAVSTLVLVTVAFAAS